MKVICSLITALMIAGTAYAKVESGSKAPEYSGPAFTQTAAGEAFSSRALSGKVAYVDFWASWCAPCRVSFPVLDGFAKKYADQGFVVVGVNKDNQLKDAQRFLSRTPVSFTLVHDDKHAIAKAFDFKTMPTGFLIDRKGIVRFVHEGFDSNSEKALQAKIEALLAEK
jgi:thiol-disulfide isomerase/thioredoxin